MWFGWIYVYRIVSVHIVTWTQNLHIAMYFTYNDKHLQWSLNTKRLIRANTYTPRHITKVIETEHILTKRVHFFVSFHPHQNDSKGCLRLVNCVQVCIWVLLCHVIPVMYRTPHIIEYIIYDTMCRTLFCCLLHRVHFTFAFSCEFEKQKCTHRELTVASFGACTS